MNRTIRYLQDVHAAEKVTEDILDKLADDGEAVAEIRLVAGEGVRECLKRRETIAARLAALGGQASGAKDFANSTMGVLSDIYNAGHDRNDKITMDAIKAHSALHLLHGSYNALDAFTTLVNDPETSSIAATHANEAMMSAERLIPAIRSSAKSVLAVAT